MTAGPRIRVNLAARAANAEMRRAKTRAGLIEAGLSVLSRKGPAASVEDYAAGAGVSRGTFYNYFPSPDDLHQALRRRFLRAVSADLAGPMDGVEDPAARIAILSLHLVVYCVRNSGEARAMFQLDRLRPERRPGDKDLYADALRAGVAAGRFRKVDVEAARTLISGAVRMAALDAMAEPERLAAAETVVFLVLAGLGLDDADAVAVTRLAAGRIATPA